MVKTRGCSCWPFFKSKPSNDEESKKKISKKSIQSRPFQNFSPQIPFGPNHLQIQRNQSLQNDAQGQNAFNRSRTTEIQRTGSSASHVNSLWVPQAPIPFINNNQSNQIINQNSNNNADEVRARNKVRIKTNITKSQVKFLDEYPLQTEEQQLYKYCCPICLRYFNTILVSTCCKNYICRLCIGEMAKKAKRDSNFIIKCPHCLECEFKLEDVKSDDTLKFYTDTPFKNQKTKQDHNVNSQKTSSSKKSNLKTKENECDQSGQTSNQIVSPSFQIHLTDISYQNLARNSEHYNLVPQLMNQPLQVLKQNIPRGDHDQPNQDSSVSIQNNALNKLLKSVQIQDQSPINEEIIDYEKDESNKKELTKFDRKLSVKSIPLFKNDMSSFMDAIHLQNSESFQNIKSEYHQQTLRISFYKENKELLNHSYLRQSLNQIKQANKKECSYKDRLRYNCPAGNKSFQVQELDEEIKRDSFENLILKRQNRKGSVSNHSNKSEEMRSTVKQEVNQVNAYGMDSFSPSLLYIKHTDLNIQYSYQKSKHIPIKDFIKQKTALSDSQLFNIDHSSLNNSQKKLIMYRKPEIIRTSQQIISPSNYKADDLQMKLRERLQYMKHEISNTMQVQQKE